MPTNIVKSQNEILSELMDGEVNDLELRRLLKSLDDDALQTWRRYQVSAALMKSDKRLYLQRDISAAVSTALAAEASPAPRAAVGLRSISSFAVAASISLVVFLGVQYDFSGLPNTAAGQSVVDIAEGQAPTISDGGRVMFGAEGLSLQADNGFATVSAQLGDTASASQIATERAAADELAAEKLRLYLEPHTIHSADNSNQGVLPFARLPEPQQ